MTFAPSRSFTTKKPAATPINIESPPADSVSDISFNIENTHMVVSSWDCTVRLYSMPPIMSSFSPTRNFRLEKTFTLAQPVLSATFFNNSIVAGLVDGTLVQLDVAGNKNAISAHGAGIKKIKNFANQFIVSCSFDSTLKFWDLKSNAPLHTITLPAKAYSMDLQGDVLAVMLADKSVHVYNINNIASPSVFPVRFNYSPRSVALATDFDSLAVGGVEAKIHVFSRSIESRKVTFRGHKVNQRLYAVNMVRFVPNDPKIVISGGSDGTIIAFDRSSHMKLGTLEFQAPITAGEVTPDGHSLVFAVGDDWSKGYTNTPVATKLQYVDIKALIGVK